MQVKFPHFNVTSHIAYRPIAGALTDVQVRMVFKTASTEDGLLLYSANADDGVGDFLSLAIKDGHIEFRFDSGSGDHDLYSSSYFSFGCQY
jgi:hypothetical protein